MCTPSPVNPLGVKGMGESGTIGVTPAVVNAVMDALRPYGIRHLDMPLTAEKTGPPNGRRGVNAAPPVLFTAVSACRRTRRPGICECKNVKYAT